MRIAVVGDSIIDMYTHCTFKKMCPDAPHAMALIREKTQRFVGGAANVAMNVAALDPNVNVDLISFVDGTLNEDVREKVNVFTCESWPVLKERFLVDNKIVLRVDEPSEGDFSKFKQVLEEYFKIYNPDLIILSDYADGIAKNSYDILFKYKDKLIIDTKESDLSIFDGCFLCKLNKKEYENALLNYHSPEQFFSALIVTDGENGSTLLVNKKFSHRRNVNYSLYCKAIKTEVVDVCGCGDTFIAGLAVSLLKNSDPYTAMQFANAAASTVVSKFGVSIADRDETLKIIGRK